MINDMGQSNLSVRIHRENSFHCTFGIVAVIWLASEGRSVEACTVSESEALLQFRNRISGVYPSSWVRGSDCCEWEGVTCTSDNSSVISIDLRDRVITYPDSGEVLPILDHLCALQKLQILDLRNNNVTGTVPACIGDFEALTFLDLSNNSLVGELPSSFSRLSELSFLDISYNLLHGKLSELFEIASAHGNLKALRYIAVSGNNFSGQVPLFENCYQLEKVKLGGNSFEGPIPDYWSSLRNLQMLSLNHNKLTGPLLDLRNCSHLAILDVISNQLNGTIPSWLLYLSSSLTVLMLSSNRFQGSFPASLESLDHLIVIDLSDNELSGTLGLTSNASHFPALKTGYQSTNNNQKIIRGDFPTAWDGDIYVLRDRWYEDATNITQRGNNSYQHRFSCVPAFDISHNSLRGTIPSEFEDLDDLMHLNLSSNLFSGSIPPHLSTMVHLYSLDLSFNYLTGVIPNELTFNGFMFELNVSYNRLSGLIPQGYHFALFDVSSYLGNPGLCGYPLDPCTVESMPSNSNPNSDQAESNEIFENWIGKPALIVGFVVGFLGNCSLILVNKNARRRLFRIRVPREMRSQSREGTEEEHYGAFVFPD